MLCALAGGLPPPNSNQGRCATLLPHRWGHCARRCSSSSNFPPPPPRCGVQGGDGGERGRAGGADLGAVAAAAAQEGALGHGLSPPLQ